MLALIGLGALSVTSAHADPFTYSSYSVLNDQNVTLTDSSPSVNDSGGAGQITLTAATGSLSTWCIDIQHYLQPFGSFTTGTFVTGVFGSEVNALLTHVLPTLSTNSDASAALQFAIWEEEYGSGLSISSPDTSALNLATTYVNNVTNGTWKANNSVQVAELYGNGTNQNQAYLVAVPEPASLALVGAGLAALGLIRRRRA